MRSSVSTPDALVNICQAVLKDGKLFVDCTPTKFPGKHLIEVPDDAIISTRSIPEAPADYCILIDLESTAGKMFRAIFAVKQAWN